MTVFQLCRRGHYCQTVLFFPEKRGRRACSLLDSPQLLIKMSEEINCFSHSPPKKKKKKKGRKNKKKQLTTAPHWALGDKTRAFGIKLGSGGSRSSVHHRGEGGERREEPLSHQSSADSPCEAVSANRTDRRAMTWPRVVAAGSYEQVKRLRAVSQGA